MAEAFKTVNFHYRDAAARWSDGFTTAALLLTFDFASRFRCLTCYANSSNFGDVYPIAAIPYGCGYLLTARIKMDEVGFEMVLASTDRLRKWLHNEAATGRSTQSVPQRRLSPHLSKLSAQPFLFSGLVRLDRKSAQLVVLNVGLHLTPGAMSLHREDATRSVSRL